MTLLSDVGHVCVALCHKIYNEKASWDFLRRFFEDFSLFLSIAVVEGVFFSSPYISIERIGKL